MNLRLLILSVGFVFGTLFLNAEEGIVTKNLILDLDAARGVTLADSTNRVVRWENQVADSPAKAFVLQDKGRKVVGSGRPTLKTNATNDQPALVFRQQELVNHNEDAFDHLTTGSGYTWICVFAPYKQRVGLKDVNSFFGNLANRAKYEGMWGCLNDDNTIWSGDRNGRSFGRFDKNNPKLLGPKLTEEKYVVVAGRLQPGKGRQMSELFVNGTTAVASAMFPVNPNANPSKMVIGQERDAIQHPGKESFDGEIARFLIYTGALNDAQLGAVITSLSAIYAVELR